MEKIGVSPCNDHYYDAEENYSVEVEGVLSLNLDTEALNEHGLSDKEIRDTIGAADHDLEIDEVKISETDIPEF